MGRMGEGKGRCGGVKKYVRVHGVSVEKVRGEVWGVLEKVKRDVGGMKKCGAMCEGMYGVSVEGVEKCVVVWGRLGEMLGYITT